MIRKAFIRGVSWRTRTFRSFSQFKSFDDAFIRKMAALCRETSLKEGKTLFARGNPATSLYVVIEGNMVATTEAKIGKAITVAHYKAGDLVGTDSLLVGGKHNTTVTATEKTLLAELDRTDFEELMFNFPDVNTHLKDMVSHYIKRIQLAEVLPEYFKDMEKISLDYIESLFLWVHLKRGEVLFKKGDIGDSLYILINGLLHVMSDGDENGENGSSLIAMITRGSIVGEMALLSDQVRSRTLYAARDCDLVRLTRESFEHISEKYPEVMVAITRILVSRLRQIRSGPEHHKNALCIAVVPVTPGVPTRAFSDHLKTVFSTYGPTYLLRAEVLNQLLDKRRVAQFKNDDPCASGLRAWFEEIESTHSFVIYEAEGNAGGWTRRCLNRADQVIFLANGRENHTPGALEKQLVDPRDIGIGPTSPRKILVLTHPQATLLPSGTQFWLKERQMDAHYHIRMDRQGDFHRLARILSGRAVGLALGGGAAKGIAHIGVIRALEEAGIFVDMVAGTSMGAIIGAAYAMGNDYRNMLDLCKKLFLDINPFNEFTLPFIALLRGRKVEFMGKVAYGDSHIEDLWLNFFCISSNLTTSQVVVHRDGLLRKAVRSSSAIPGLLAPVMQDGEMHVDGGILNNLPGDILRRYCGRVVAVEVVPNEDLISKMNEVPSPWKMLWSRLLPFRKPIKAPTVLDIMLSTVLSGSFVAANTVKADAELTLTPPLKQIGFMEFKKMEQAAEIGYQYTSELLEKLGNQNLMETLKGL